MSGGIKHDGDKTRYELLPPEFLEGVARVLTMGARKYSDRNWEQGISYSRVFGATMRHLWAWWRGEDLDKESGMPHLWHASCELAFLVAFEARTMTQLDDRPNGSKARVDVLPERSSQTPHEFALREDEQSIPPWDPGCLVFWEEGGSMDRVQVDRPPITSRDPRYY